MNKRLLTLIWCIILSIFCGIMLFNKPESITILVFEVENGYGYSIIDKNKTLIKQNFIPAIESKIPFCTENEALAIAKLVKSKIDNNLPPTISIEELSKNNIQKKCSK